MSYGLFPLLSASPGREKSFLTKRTVNMVEMRVSPSEDKSKSSRWFIYHMLELGPHRVLFHDRAPASTNGVCDFYSVSVPHSHLIAARQEILSAVKPLEDVSLIPPTQSSTPKWHRKRKRTWSGPRGTVGYVLDDVSEVFSGERHVDMKNRGCRRQ